MYACKQAIIISNKIKIIKKTLGIDISINTNTLWLLLLKVLLNKKT